MDFISRDALIAAMNAWVLDKAKPLGQILREQGALTETRHACWRPWSRSTWSSTATTPSRAWPPLSSVGSVRGDLQAVADPDVQASLAHAWHRAAGAGDPYPNRTLALGRVADRLRALRFRILRPHAAAAWARSSSPTTRNCTARWPSRRSRTATPTTPTAGRASCWRPRSPAAWSIPGIVPVYGLGHYADGRPFYAMRFIRGDSLKEAIERFHQPDGAGPRPGRAGAGAAPAAAAGSSTSATPSPTPTAAACCTAT